MTIVSTIRLTYNLGTINVELRDAQTYEQSIYFNVYGLNTPDGYVGGAVVTRIVYSCDLLANLFGQNVQSRLTEKCTAILLPKFYQWSIM